MDTRASGQDWSFGLRLKQMIFRKWDGGRGMDWIDLAQDRDS